MKNLTEFKALINRYETITIEEIRGVFDIDPFGRVSDETTTMLTGYGHIGSCSLCVAVSEDGDPECSFCVYASNHERCSHSETYQAIWMSESEEELLAAYRNRAKYMREVLKKLNIEY